MNKLKVVALPNGRWCLEYNNERSHDRDYNAGIFWQYSPEEAFFAETAYYGKKGIHIRAAAITEISLQFEDHSV